MGVEAYGDFPFYFPQSGAKISFEYHVRFTGEAEGPAQDADVAEARVYKRGEASDANLATTEQLSKNGDGTLDLDISGFVPKDDSPLLVEFFFQKEWSEGTRAGETDEEKLFCMVALATPAVAAIEATPAEDVKSGDEVKLKVTDWGGLVYDEPGEPQLHGGADPARYPSGTKGQTKWRQKIGGADWQDMDATGERASYTADDESARKWLRFEAYLEEQPEEHRPLAEIEPPRRKGGGEPGASWQTSAYRQASKDYRESELQAAEQADGEGSQAAPAAAAA